MRHSFIERMTWVSVAAIAATIMLASSAAMAATELLVYTAIESDELPALEEAFESSHPNIDIHWVRDSTGIITAKLLAEKENPQADIAWGISATSLLFLANEGYFQPYAPKGIDQLNPKFVGKKNPPLWVGQRAYAAVICVNTIVAEEMNLPMPDSWSDLTKPVYEGHLAMPNPASSGTGFLTVNGWMQMWGAEKAWNYMDKLHQNMKWYTHSGSQPCRQAAHGEIAIGISFAYRGAVLKEKGAPIKLVIPKEGVGWDAESFAIVEGTDNLEAARTFADWSISRDAMKLYSKSMAVLALPGVGDAPKYFPPNVQERMIDNDLQWAADHRAAIIDKWASRYATKSLPKT